MLRSLILLVSAPLTLLACSDDGLSSSSSGSSGEPSSSSGNGDTTSSSSSGGNTCGYESDCVAASGPTAVFCTSNPGTAPYQCCKPATPPESAGCTIATSGQNESIATYCCSGTP
jgi:hypothetical protein